MIALVLILCIAGGPCREVPVPGATFTSAQACTIAAQPLAAAWLADHPSRRWLLNRWRCGPEERPL